MVHTDPSDPPCGPAHATAGRRRSVRRSHHHYRDPLADPSYGLAGCLFASLPGLTGAQEIIMDITRKADLKTVDGPPEYFTGKATITGQFQRQDPSCVSGAIVHFEPGARTAWHKHPLGRTLIVTEGVGWTQIEGGQVYEFYAGDVLWCPPEHKHWHGATPHEGMTHIAIQEMKEGSPVTWMEHVRDDEYLRGPGNADA
jgi:quercetin dioxygenase-like cupin family protein